MSAPNPNINDQLSHAAKTQIPESFVAWACRACTFLNEDPLHLECAVCGTAKVEQQDIVPSSSSSGSSGGSNLILPGAVSVEGKASSGKKSPGMKGGGGATILSSTSIHGGEGGMLPKRDTSAPTLANRKSPPEYLTSEATKNSLPAKASSSGDVTAHGVTRKEDVNRHHEKNKQEMGKADDEDAGFDDFWKFCNNADDGISNKKEDVDLTPSPTKSILDSDKNIGTSDKTAASVSTAGVDQFEDDHAGLPPTVGMVASMYTSGKAAASASMASVDQFQDDGVGLPPTVGMVASKFQAEEDSQGKKNHLVHHVEDETEAEPLHPSAMEAKCQQSDEVIKKMAMMPQAASMVPPAPFNFLEAENKDDEGEKKIAAKIARNNLTSTAEKTARTRLPANIGREEVSPQVNVGRDNTSASVASYDAKRSSSAPANTGQEGEPPGANTRRDDSASVAQHDESSSSPTNTGGDEGPPQVIGGRDDTSAAPHIIDAEVATRVRLESRQDSTPMIPEAFAVDDNVIFATQLEPLDSTPPEPSPPWWKETRALIPIAVAFAVVVLVSIVSLVVSLSSRNNNMNDRSETTNTVITMVQTSSPILPGLQPSPPSTTPPQYSSERPSSLSLRTCKNLLQDQIYVVSARVGTSNETLGDRNSPQYKASEWLLEECEAAVPIDPCTPSQRLLNEQRYALAVMYYSLGGQGWTYGRKVSNVTSKGTWMSKWNYCEWSDESTDSSNQIVCDEFGNVLELNLESNGMMGTIPLEIGALVFMSSYTSSFNAISGPIPTSLGLIAPLQTFDVSSNNMGGELFQAEYSGPDGLAEVVQFVVDSNNFQGNIPTEIGLWSRLQTLGISSNEIAGTIPTEIGYLVDMKVCLLFLNQITGTIPSEIGNLDKLSWINIERNKIDGTIPEELFSNLDLTHVILKNNFLSGTIPKKVGELSKLMHIDMDNNQITGAIPEELYSNLDLQWVHLKKNFLSGTISDRIGDLSKIAYFWTSSNELVGTIPTTFGNCINLKWLELQNNNLSGPIPEEFGNMKSIIDLYVGSNDLTGTIPSEIFGENMTNLHLNDNQLSGPVPENYGQSWRLEELWLNNNKLTGTLPIIAEGELSYLVELRINNNKMTGEVDNSLCQNNLDVFHADCHPPNGEGEPHIVCGCCTTCFSSPSSLPSSSPSSFPSESPSLLPSSSPSSFPSESPSLLPSFSPTRSPSKRPSVRPTPSPSKRPSARPTPSPSKRPSARPTRSPSKRPSARPTRSPSKRPSARPTRSPSKRPSARPTSSPSKACSNPGNCMNYLKDQMFAVSVRVGTPMETLDNRNSAHYKASQWILEECDATTPIDLCSISQMLLREQRYALSVLYFSLGGERWSRGSNPNLDTGWLSGSNYCIWSGVICDAFGNVLQFSLEDNNMIGTIPHEIGIFDKLWRVSMDINQITSTIPEEFYSNHDLKEVYLFENSLTGTISNRVGELSKLEAFEVENNNFDGTIPSTFGNCHNLEWLLLDENNFSGPIPNTIRNLKNLEVLGLSHNYLAGTIPTLLEAIPNLLKLFLDGNNFNGAVPCRDHNDDLDNEDYELIADCYIQCHCCTDECDGDYDDDA